MSPVLAGMSGVPYDPEHIARFYEYGAREWERFDLSSMDRVGMEVHLRLLREHFRDGDRVLDAGAGPGRFTSELGLLSSEPEHRRLMRRWPVTAQGTFRTLERDVRSSRVIGEERADLAHRPRR